MFNLESLSSTDVCYVHVKLTSSYHGLLSVLLVLLYVIVIVIINKEVSAVQKSAYDIHERGACQRKKQKVHLVHNTALSHIQYTQTLQQQKKRRMI